MLNWIFRIALDIVFALVLLGAAHVITFALLGIEEIIISHFAGFF